jgi:hypothetical protein
MVEKLQQPCFVENVGIICLLFLFRFLSSMAKRFQQPYFVESVGGVDEVLTSIGLN